jgi:Plant transposon protein.
MDGKHVLIQAPHNSGSYYFNYKGQHSIVLMAIVDAEYKFLVVTIGSNGRVSDGGVFRASGVADFIETAAKDIEKTPLPGRRLCVPHVFVADDAFPLQSHIMKPYPFNSQGSMRIYNYRISRARRIVENAFGIMSSIFRVLRKPILLAPERVDSVVLAVCSLHNWLLSEKSSANIYASEGTFDRENLETGEIIHGSWRNEEMPADSMLPLAQQGSNNYSNNAKEVREEFQEYFISSQGEVPWQYRFM